MNACDHVSTSRNAVMHIWGALICWDLKPLLHRETNKTQTMHNTKFHAQFSNTTVHQMSFICHMKKKRSFDEETKGQEQQQGSAALNAGTSEV